MTTGGGLAGTEVMFVMGKMEGGGGAATPGCWVCWYTGSA